MQITGTAHMRALIPEAWKAFHDPGVLERTIPGLQSLEQTGEDAYKATVSAGVASIKGTYTGRVALTEQQEYESFLLRAQGEGGPGTIAADVRVRLTEAEDGGTDIVWGADAAVGGPIGGVGQRMLQGVARKMATQFFKAIDDDIASGGGERQLPSNGDAAAQEGTGPTSTETTTTRHVSTVTPPAPTVTSGKELAAGALFGAMVALIGVITGALIRRK